MTISQSTPAVSVIICTHNRAPFLAEALHSLRSQSCQSDLFEVIVVDNRSTDDTRQVCDAARADGLPLRYLSELRLGVSFARNSGWREALSPIVAFLDDDALPNPEWIQCIVLAFASADSRLGVLGGKVTPRWLGPKPDWVHDSNEIALGYIDYGPQCIELDPTRSPIGANIAYPRHVLQQTGGFPESLGRKGDSLLACEEVFLERKLRSLGFKVLYDPAVVVQHAVHADRLTPAWLSRRVYWQGASLAICDLTLEPISPLQRIQSTLLCGARLCVPPLRTLLRAMRGTDSIEAWRRSFIFRLGYFSGLTGLHRLRIRDRHPSPPISS